VLQQNNLLFFVRVFFSGQPEVVSNHYLTWLIVLTNLRTPHHNYSHNLYWLNGRKKALKAQETTTGKWPAFYTYSSFLLRLLRFFAAIKLVAAKGCAMSFVVNKNQIRWYSEHL
jgi:hypothetical protein